MNELINDFEAKHQAEELKAQQQLEREKQLRDAIEKYQQAAIDGDAVAQYDLAWAYFQAGDYVTSLSWWKQAADKGFTGAWTRIAVQYAYGLGVEQDQTAALDAMWKAVKGNPEDYNALCSLGMFYEQGIGMEQNMEQALTCYRQAAEHKEPMAQFALGMCYFFGNGLEQNDKLAMEWAQQAAQQDWAEAQYFLGLQHYLGEHTDQDLYLALSYLRKAEENGSLDAVSLAKVVEREIQVQQQVQDMNNMTSLLDQMEAYLNSFGEYVEDDEDEE